MRAARCIAISYVRCTRKAGKRSGDFYLCAAHSTMWTMLLLDDRCAPQTRRMLAFARWNTYAEGKRLIDRMHRKKAA